MTMEATMRTMGAKANDRQNERPEKDTKCPEKEFCIAKHIQNRVSHSWARVDNFSESTNYNTGGTSHNFHENRCMAALALHNYSERI